MKKSCILQRLCAAGVLPPRVILVGCEPQTCEEYSQTLSSPVQTAVVTAAARVRELVAGAAIAAVG